MILSTLNFRSLLLRIDKVTGFCYQVAFAKVHTVYTDRLHSLFLNDNTTRDTKQ